MEQYFNKSSYFIQLTQSKHAFPFGAAVGAEHIVDPALTKYQNVFFDLFEWGVLHNALKWTGIERRQVC